MKQVFHSYYVPAYPRSTYGSALDGFAVRFSATWSASSGTGSTLCPHPPQLPSGASGTESGCLPVGRVVDAAQPQAGWSTIPGRPGQSHGFPFGMRDALTISMENCPLSGEGRR